MVDIANLGITANVLSQALLAFYLFLGSTSIGYVFFATGFRGAKALSKDFLVGSSVLTGLAFSSLVIVFSLAGSFLTVEGLGFLEFFFIFVDAIFLSTLAAFFVKSSIIEKLFPAGHAARHRQAPAQVAADEKPQEVFAKPVQAIEKKEEFYFDSPATLQAKPVQQAKTAAKGIEWPDFSEKMPENETVAIDKKPFAVPKKTSHAQKETGKKALSFEEIKTEKPKKAWPELKAGEIQKVNGMAEKPGEEKEEKYGKEPRLERLLREKREKLRQLREGEKNL